MNLTKAEFETWVHEQTGLEIEQLIWPVILTPDDQGGMQLIVRKLIPNAEGEPLRSFDGQILREDRFIPLPALFFAPVPDTPEEIDG